MSFLKNKHVITAMMVAPLLAVASYFMVDLVVQEPALEPVAGQAYHLIAKSNCRFSSGHCDLENGTFKSTIRVEKHNGTQIFHLRSLNSLQAASVGFVDKNGIEVGPLALTQDKSNQQNWAVIFESPANKNTQLRLALTAGDAYYYAETMMEFSEYQTSFDKDFRQ